MLIIGNELNLWDMKNDLSKHRKSYEKNELTETNVPNKPIDLFKKWFDEVEALESGLETNAMTLSTTGADGYPRARVVLLKSFSTEGFVFFTNYNSDKARSIENNKAVCLSFFWPEAERQVIIKGVASKISEAESDAYFKTRPRGSQLGAHVSNQSTIISGRDVLETELNRLKARFKNKEVPRPHFWGGYCVEPQEFEFWQGRANRLHDRIVYKPDTGNSWKIIRLAP